MEDTQMHDFEVAQPPEVVQLPQEEALTNIRTLIRDHAPNHPLLTASDQVLVFTLLQTKYALRIEVTTGLRHSKGSTLKALNHTFGTSFTRKQQALEFITNICDSITDPIIADPA